jgi:hypothetical protein
MDKGSAYGRMHTGRGARTGKGAHMARKEAYTARVYA